ncbi:MAG TPA: SDR family oxidoreductase [Pseudomonadales bacterium]|nr:SDR family oxidoreductase [Pseudomonadales bacterium]
MRLEGRVAVVTGGASGMGRATVRRFLEEGASVLVADYNAATGEATLAEAHDAGYGERVRFLRTDVADEDQVAAMIDAAVDAFGRLDVVFNNAGVGGAIGPLTETTEADFDYTMAVLCKGVFFGIKHAARRLRAQGEGGVIINTASVAALSGDGGPLVYSAAKAAVVSMTRSAAVELAADRIRVNAICPGLIATPLPGDGDEEKAARRFEGGQPWPETGTGDHIAGAALFLASEDSRFVTGEAMVVDGGLSAEGPALSRRMPNLSARNAGVSGVTRGSTGEGPTLRKL